MPHALLTIGLLAPLVFVFGEVASGAETRTLKCAVRISDQVRYLIDGRETDSLAMNALESTDVRSVAVQCVSPVDLSAIAPGSNVPGVTALTVWTNSGPLSQLEPLLARINDAQRAHFGKTGDYALTLDELRIGDVPDDVRLALDAAPGRWRAEAVVTLPTSPRCVVFDGQHSSPTPGSPGVVRCESL